MDEMKYNSGFVVCTAKKSTSEYGQYHAFTWNAGRRGEITFDFGLHQHILRNRMTTSGQQYDMVGKRERKSKFNVAIASYPRHHCSTV